MFEALIFRLLYICEKLSSIIAKKANAAQ